MEKAFSFLDRCVFVPFDKDRDHVSSADLFDTDLFFIGKGFLVGTYSKYDHDLCCCILADTPIFC